jgi:hypothetical protein
MFVIIAPALGKKNKRIKILSVTLAPWDNPSNAAFFASLVFALRKGSSALRE